MPLGRARVYHLYSRTLVPLGALYAAGHALGHLLYVSTGHLGLFAGPLGELKRAFLTTGPHRWAAASDSWLNWAAPLMCAVLLVVELQRHSARRSTPGERALQIGYSLAAVGGVAGLLLQGTAHRPEGGAVLGVTAVAAAIYLTRARWPQWRPRIRLFAAGLCVAGIIIAVWTLRWRDQLELGGWL